MEIRNLITFAQVAELGSFTKAADSLGYSQSTVSFHIKQLENEMGFALFERINHNVSLTEKGAEVLEFAKQIRNLTEDFSSQMAAPSEFNGFIRIVAPDSICEDMINTNYSDFHSKFPKLRLRFSTADTEDMFKILSRNEADLMLTLDNHAYRQDFVIAHEERVDMHFVTGANSPYATDKKLKLSTVASYPLILTEHGTGYRHVFDETMAKHSIDIQPILELGRTDVITSVLDKGIGVSFLPDFVTRKKVSEGKLIYLNVPDMEADVWKQLIYHKNKWKSRSMSALIDYIIGHEFGR